MILISLFCFVSILNYNLSPVTSQCLTEDDTLSLMPTGDLSMIVKFELDLFKLLLPKDSHDSFVFSPYSVWNCLVLAYFGSAGETERQIQRTINVDDKISTLRKWRRLQYLYMMRPETSINNTFVLANKAYFDEMVYVKPCMENFLFNEIEVLDFTQSVSAAAHINNFVSETTQGTIENLVTADDVLNARMVIANAAYFKGRWKLQFDPMSTRSLPFHCSDGRIENVDLMLNLETYRHGFDDYLKTEVLELPYDGDIISMIVLLPYDSSYEGVNNVLTKITPMSFRIMMNNLVASEMMVLLPRFTIDTYAGDELILVLNQMGLIDPFDPSVANFTGYAPYNNLALDKSVHKAYIAVNEEGTEASAATAFISTRFAPPTFRCDRPFLFAIRDNETKNLMFLGVYKGPPAPPTGPYDQVPVDPPITFNDYEQQRTFF